ncbi:MAG: SDR family NAD(P)-dependent oxidoreductase [Bacteroides sp.]|nr:SDR family NAD(P)-dependent oxidoreductase [Bacteroides sp.]
MNILIIGATSGIGFNLWQHYSSSGHSVAVIGRRQPEIDRMIGLDPQHTLGYTCDIADTAVFNDAFSDIVGILGSLDLIIVCAGIGELNPGLDVLTELSTIRVNVYGWINCIDHAYNLLAEKGSGQLVAITSVGGLQPTPVAPSYSASKAFQINYIKSLQQKSRKTGVTVTEIRPGLVDTRMAKGDGLFWVMPLDKVSSSIIRAIERKRRRLMVTRRWRRMNIPSRHFA